MKMKVEAGGRQPQRKACRSQQALEEARPVLHRASRGSVPLLTP